MMLILIISYWTKSHMKITLIYHPPYKAQYGVKALHITFEKVYEYIRKYNRTKCLV